LLFLDLYKMYKEEDERVNGKPGAPGGAK